MARLKIPFQIKPGQKIRLVDWDSADSRLFPDGKDKAVKETDKLTKRLGELQNVFYAENKHKLLIVLQAMDTGRKDGTIRNVFDDVNPLGVRVANFKKPTEHELSKDYLWRVHAQAPAKGEIVIFNRSHYEDVLFLRAHGLMAKKTLEQRYGHINDFERMLTDEGATLLKFFLHISKDEQRQRLRERMEDPQKRWKFREGDLEERKLWREYQEAYEGILSHTSTAVAPWHIIPADKKWFRNWLVAKTIVATLEGFRSQFPKVTIPRSVKIL